MAIAEMTRAGELNERRERLGRAATYRALAERINRTIESRRDQVSHKSINIVLTEAPSPIKMNRERIMDLVEQALDAIEAEQHE